jgi:hypothetical protein
VPPDPAGDSRDGQKKKPCKSDDLQGFEYGGRDRDRTCDPYDVNDVPGALSPEKQGETGTTPLARTVNKRRT